MTAPTMQSHPQESAAHVPAASCCVPGRAKSASAGALTALETTHRVVVTVKVVQAVGGIAKVRSAAFVAHVVLGMLLDCF